MRREEGLDAPPSVLGCDLVVTEPGDHVGQAHPAFMVVEERMTGLGVLLDVVFNAEALEGGIERGGGAAHAAVAGAVARYDRAGSAQRGVGIPRQRRVVG